MREATKYVNNPFHHTLSTQNLFFLQHISFDSLLGKTVLYSILKRILFVKEIIKRLLRSCFNTVNAL